jgi:ribosome biogenesis GTPase A
MKSFWMVVNKVIKRSDIILLVLDARFPELSRNPELEDKTVEKPIIYILNKCDLVEKKSLEKWKRKLKNCVFVSAKKHFGVTILHRKILEQAKGKKVTIGVVGYPNTGKSSVINALRGKKSAKTSSQSGYTKGKQLIRISQNIMLLDTPGVFPYREEDKTKLALINAIDFNKVEDPDLVAMELIKQKPKMVQAFYDIKENDPEEFLEALAKKLNKIGKGGVFDLKKTAKIILRDWQRGVITKSP